MYSSRSTRCVISALTITAMLFTPGCSRKFWREQAERDTYDAIAEKQNDQRWLLPRVNITPDKRSRFYDPYDPDAEPLPPDDPAASEYMRCANGMKGYKSWHKFGDTLSVENPQWLEPFGVGLDGTGAIDPASAHSSVQLRQLTLQEAIELSYIHSRTYQTQIENLYLDSLALTFQRFQFGVRYLPEPNLGLGSSHRAGSDTYSVSNGLGLSQLLPAGGQWAIQLANNTLWLFGTGADAPASASNLAFSLVQPLLFRAGRHVAMEGLTQAERNVLYTTRDLARFRREFFTDTASSYLNILLQQQQVQNQISNIERLEKQIAIRRVLDRRVPFQTSARLRALPEDFMIPEELEGLLKYDADEQFLFWRDDSITDEQAAALLAISDDRGFQRAAELIIEFLGPNSDSTLLPTLQLLTDLSGSQNTLQTRERVLQDQLDNFKLQLGLPPDIELDIDASLLEPFELINENLVEVEKALEESLQLVRDANAENPFENVVAFIDELDRIADVIRTYGIQSILDEFEPVEALLEAGGRSGLGGRTFENEEEIERVRSDLGRDKRLYKVAKSEFDLAVEDLEVLKSLVSESTAEASFQKLDLDMDGFIQLRELNGLFDESLQRRLDTDGNREASVEELVAVIETIARELREPMLFATQSFEVVQAGLRTELIGVNDFTLPGMDEPTIEEAVRVGLESRLDLMNVRAEVMDARRRLEIAANGLESTLDLRVDGSLGTEAGNQNPLNFSSDEAQLDIGLQLTTPLDQIDERNAYARALVAYQRARRAYMAAEDLVKSDIRRSYRQLTVAKRRLEIDRRQIRQAALQYDSSAQQASRGSQQNALSLLRSLESLLRAQNALISDWIQYEVNRLNIYRDMGIMEVDARGVWNDEFYQRGQNTPADPGFNDFDAIPSDEMNPSELPLNLDEEPTDEPIFPLEAVPGDAAPNPPAVPNNNPVEPIIPKPPAAAGRVRRMDRARFGNFGRRRSTGDPVVAGKSNGAFQLRR